MPLVFITGNDGKFREAKLIFPQLERKKLDIPEFQAESIHGVIEAKLAWASAQYPELNIIVEDSGIIAPSWGRGLLPGPYTKDFLKNFSLDELVQLFGVGGPAKAVAAVGLKQADAPPLFGAGEISGKFVSPRGSGGFGWDPIFQPEGHARSFGEMTMEEKSALSHRQRAFQELKRGLATNDGKQ